MTPIMANLKDGQDHEKKYFGKKISSQEMTTCNMEALVSFKEVMTNVLFFGSNVAIKRLHTNKMISDIGSIKSEWTLSMHTLLLYIIIILPKYIF